MDVVREDNNFYIELGEDLVAEIICEKKNNKLVVLSVFVPEDYRGQGIATKMMEEVVNYAKKNSLEIVPECSFAQKYCEAYEC